MVLEVAILNVRPGECNAFEQAFDKAKSIIRASPGYISHELMKCIEQENQYILLVRWETIEDHEIGFRQSDAKRLLHHFYDPFPVVEHYASLKKNPCI